MITFTQPLTPKFTLPPCASGLIDRPQLLGLIEQAQMKQVTVIRAGPGFGKTTLAIAWARRLQQRNILTAWLTLDDDDDEPARFFLYASHAFQSATNWVGGAAIDLLSDISLVSFDTIVSSWVNDLVRCEDDVYLFLDNCHLVTDHEISRSVAYFLEYAPRQFHLVLTAVDEPSLPLSRLRAHNQLFEIDAAAMRFDEEETIRFLEREKINGLDPSEVRILHAKTEGWPAVLRIVASTLSQPEQDAGGYVRGLSGALRPVGAYLSELLAKLPERTVQFMLRIAILDRFSADLCQAVTGLESSRQILDTLDTGRLLLTPLDGERDWYSYHSLLAGHLRQRLEAEHGDEIPKLHRRTYRWFASHQHWTDAVRHAIAAGDADQATSWVENCAMDLVKKGDLLTLLSWRRLFPTELKKSQVKVGLAIAWGLALAMRFVEALELVSKVEAETDSPDQGEADFISCECMAIRATVAALRDDSKAALPLAEACLENLDNPWTANVASNVALFAHWKAGDLESFYGMPWIAHADDEDRRNLFAFVYRRCLHGLVELQQLQLAAAEHNFTDALQLAERHSGPKTAAMAFPGSLLARIRYEQGRLNEAEAMIVDLKPLIDATGTLEAVLSAYQVLSDIAGYRGDAGRVAALAEQLESLGQMRNWGRAIGQSLVVRARRYALEGRIAETRACLSRLQQLEADFPAPALCAWSDIRTYGSMVKALLHAAENRPSCAIAILRTLRQEAEANGNRLQSLRFALMLAENLFAAGQGAEAECLFEEILRAAAVAGLRQSLLDGSPEIGPLLLRFEETALRTGRSRDLLPFVRKLIESLREIRPHMNPDAIADTAGSLSPREKDILERIASGQSNKEIARNLGIAPETVKSHVKNIFVKLAVERRAQAVSRALSLGLVRAS